jgi:RimJ/RimL family protein N-acetyltransferase
VADAQAPIADGAVRLRPATNAHLSFVLATETDARRAGFIGGWTETEHRTALDDDDVAHCIIETEGDGETIGYLILRGLRDTNGSIELKRLALAAHARNRGYGRRVLALVLRYAFDQLSAHRLWLDVLAHNTRARHLYTSSGFVEEGVLRECFRTESAPGGYASLVVMSILEPEYRAAVREPAAGQTKR